jgi:hypothetical protein
MNNSFVRAGSLLLTLLLSTGCVQVQTGNDVVDATSAVVSGVYLQKQIDEQKAKSAKPDIFKTTDPKVKDIDAAIEKARSRKQVEATVPSWPNGRDAGANNG